MNNKYLSHCSLNVDHASLHQRRSSRVTRQDFGTGGWSPVRITGEALMTQASINTAEQGSRFNDYVAGALTFAVLALSAVMFFGPFTA
jgi:hypothetical protein